MTPSGATATAVVIFALYFAVYGLLYLWARRGVTHLERAARYGAGDVTAWCPPRR